jgi:hypothetical protein
MGGRGPAITNNPDGSVTWNFDGWAQLRYNTTWDQVPVAEQERILIELYCGQNENAEICQGPQLRRGHLGLVQLAGRATYELSPASRQRRRSRLFRPPGEVRERSGSLVGGWGRGAGWWGGARRAVRGVTW